MRLHVFFAMLMIATPAIARTAFLSGAQLRSTFAGRTITGTEDGARYQEKLLANGSIQGRSSTEKDYVGEWEVDGDEICFYYDDEDNEDDCSRVILNGSTVTFVDEDGSSSRASLK